MARRGQNTAPQSPAPYVPAPLPDEPYFSYFGRVWRLAGRPTKRSLASKMFGKVHKDEWDLFYSRPGASLSLSRVLRPTGYSFQPRAGLRHSLRALARPFWHRYPQELPNNSPQSSAPCFNRQLGMTETRFKETPSFCVDCVRQDIDEIGMAYWRRSHQVAGVWFCPSHGTGLVAECQNCGTELLFNQLPDTTCRACKSEYAPQLRFSGSESHRVSRQFGIAVASVYGGQVQGPLNNATARAHFRGFYGKRLALPGADLCEYVERLAGDTLMDELGLGYPPRERFPWPMLFLADRLVFAQASHQLLLYAALTADKPNEQLWHDRRPSDKEAVYEHSMLTAFPELWKQLRNQ